MPAPSRPSPASFLKHASEVASSYGFRPLREIERMIPNLERRAHSFAVAAGVAVQANSQNLQLPVLTYFASASPMHTPPQSSTWPARDVGEFGLQIVGVPESLAEAVLLKTVSTIINEWGTPLARVRLNALGDKDSKARFEREAGVYVRKHIAHLDPECRESLTKQPMAPYRCTSELCRGVVEGGPRAMNFLSERSRAHFREVLEHLERLSLPYEFDDLLMHDERDPRMLFAFDLAQEDATILAGTGGRFDDYLRRLPVRSPVRGAKETSGVAASLYFRKAGLSTDSFKLPAQKIQPSVYFIQLGLRAKLEGLLVLDVLRQAHIPVLQSFDPARLTPQLSAARDAKVSHLIIMGAREALDRTVLVRTMNDSSQTVVGLSELPRYLKTLR